MSTPVTIVGKILTRLKQIQAERSVLDAEEASLLDKLSKTAAVSTTASLSPAQKAVTNRNQRLQNQ